jgi:hypothetical protein
MFVPLVFDALVAPLAGQIQGEAVFGCPPCKTKMFAEDTESTASEGGVIATLKQRNVLSRCRAGCGTRERAIG